MNGSDRSYRLTIEAVAAAAMAFLLLPLVFVVLNSIGPRGIAHFPPARLNVEAYGTIPVRWLWASLSSLWLGLGSAAVGCVLGTCGALALARGDIRSRALVDLLLRSPLQVPSLVLGVAALQAYSWLAATTNLHLTGTFVGLLLMHAAVSTPYVMLVVLAKLQTQHSQLEEASDGLGASAWLTFLRVTLPMLSTAIISGGFFAFLLSVDNVPLSLFIVSAGQALLPVDLFNSIQFDLTRTIYAVATLVCLATTTAIALAYRHLATILVVAR